MPKRKTANGTSSSTSPTSSSSDDVLNISFDFFPPTQTDYHGLKALLKQLFHTSSPLLPLEKITDTILDQPALSTCVKCEDEEHTAEENDPFAFLAVVDLWERREEVGARVLGEWVRGKCAGEVGRVLSGMSGERVGLVLSERLVNMPADVAPGLWKLLLEELESASEEDPYLFTHFVVVSKTFVEVESVLEGGDGDSEEEEGPRSKKARGEPEAENDSSVRNGTGRKGKKSKDEDGEMLFFHPEDEVLMRFASAHGGFAYDNEEEGASDAKRAFNEAGIKPRGLCYLIDRESLGKAAREVETYIGGGAATG